MTLYVEDYVVVVCGRCSDKLSGTDSANCQLCIAFFTSCIQKTMPFLLRWKLIHSQHLPCLLQVVLRQGQLLLIVQLSIRINFLIRFRKIFNVNISEIFFKIFILSPLVIAVVTFMVMIAGIFRADKVTLKVECGKMFRRICRHAA